METKPVFCSECGAKLTGSTTFCSACGAKQEAAPAVQAAPDNSLAAPKAKLSVIGLIAAIFALSVTFFTEISDLCLMVFGRTYGSFDFGVLVNCLKIPAVYIGLLTAWVLPIAAVVLVLLKKKPAALAGMIATGVIILLQLLLTAYYPQYIRTYGGRFPRLLHTAYQLFNGEYLSQYLRSAFSGQHFWQMYMYASVQLNYVMKNVWVLLACLFTAIKKQK